MTSVRPRLGLGAALAVAAALLTGCSPPDDAAPVPTTPPASDVAASEGPEPTVETATLTADGIELLLTVPAEGGGERSDAAGAPAGSLTTVTPDEDGSSRVGFVLPAATAAAAASGTPGARSGGGAGEASGEASTEDTGDSGGATAAAVPASIDLVSPADGSLLRNGDGSLTVLDAAGTPLGGLSAPQATDMSGAAGRSAFVVAAPTRAEVRVRAGGAASSGGPQDTAGTPPTWTVTTWLGARGVRSATWGEREGGRSLAVDATPWARQSGTVGEATAWAQLIASEPEADSRTMRDQFDCHALGAPDKATWNLEPWRPDVGFLATAAARCNPT
ncbi:DUF2599 domain-containing protein [Oerskovia turbata]